MISAREKGLFQLLVGLQVAIVLLLYAVCALAILVIFYEQHVSLYAYGKYAVVVVIAMILEATFRPGALRLTPGRVRRLAAAVSRRQWIWTLGSVTLLLVFSKDQRISRVFLGTFALTSLVVFYTSNRYLIRFLASLGLKHLRQWRLRTIVMGPKAWCDTVVPEIKGLHAMLELKRVEWTDQADGEGPRDYAALVEQEPIDLLVVAPRHLPNATIMDLLRQGDRLGFRCWLPVELSRTFGRRFDLQRAGCLDVLTPPVEPLESTSNQFMKRLFDIAFAAAVVATVIPPICALVWLIHRRQSPGPLFFKQDRVGKNGMNFQVLKFRSLHANHGTEATQVTKGDSRIFPGGRFLRKSSLDELPQFINVLLGDMSVVGPRPHMEEHDFEFRQIFERYGVRRYVKPGVTGLAQVKGYRGEIRRARDLRHRARLDNFYVTHWDLGLDVRIVVATAGSMVKPPKTAY